MFMTPIYDLNSYSVNERNGIYGGKAGAKEAITIGNEYWIVKYPKNTSGMRGDLDSYTAPPLSEYIGSHIYEILGIDVHKTILGVRNNKLVVACKDFCKAEGSLREIRTLKNVYNSQLSQIIESDFSSTSSSQLVEIGEIITHFKYNPILNKIDGISERFWTQFLVDILINNNDRNNDNWGILYEDGKYRLAPVFDNGASFSYKTPDNKLASILESPDKLKQGIETTRTIYSRKGQELFAKDLLNFEYEELDKVAINFVPTIVDKLPQIESFIENIPEKFNDMVVCSETRKAFYINSMKLKMKWFLKPFYNKACERQNLNISEQQTIIPPSRTR